MPAHDQQTRVASARLAAAERWHPDADTTDLRRDLRAARFADRIHGEVRDLTEDAEAWADRVASSLPPLEPDEAAAVGKLAAALDARRIPGEGAV